MCRIGYLRCEGVAERQFTRPGLFFVLNSTLSFFSLVFWVCIEENLKITKDFLSLPNPQNRWKDRENTKITKEIPRFKFTKEIQKTKEKKDWVRQSRTFRIPHKNRGLVGGSLENFNLD